MYRGRCECGSVQFKVDQVRETVTVCHCSQCRRTSGHLWASTHAKYESLDFISDEGLEWYASSAIAERGFCRFCGSSLFYRMKGEAGIGIAAGSLDQTEGLAVGKNIFVSDKGDYYEIRDGKPAFEGG